MSDTRKAGSAGAGQLQFLLRHALDHLQQNQLLEAEGALGEAIKHWPNDADVLQLMGVLRQEQGQIAEAESFYRRSLKVRPRQPQVLLNLANHLRRMGKYDEALAFLRECVSYQPDMVEAHLVAGFALQDLGRWPEAEIAYRQALVLAPDSAIVKQSLGGLLNDMDRPKEAEQVLREALAASQLDPRQCAALEYNLAISARLLRQYEEALVLLDSAQKRVPELSGVDYNRGNLFQELGRFDDATASYRRAISRDPLDLLAHHELNQLLYRRADDEGFLRSYDDASAQYLGEGTLQLAKGRFLFQKGDYAAAHAEFARAATLLPNLMASHDALAMSFSRLGDYQSAIGEHEIALKQAPQDAGALRNFCETLLRAGDAKKAKLIAERSLERDPFHQGTLAYWGTALRLLGDERSEVLHGYDDLIQIFELEPPEGFRDIESFNQELNGHLGELHRDKREFLTQSLRGGTQTMENLFSRKSDLIAMLRAKIDEAVAVYISRLKSSDTHPMLKRKMGGFDYLGSWSSRLHDCGYHTNHFHHKGWISSAYYVDLPDVVGDAEQKQGWLKFGEPAFDTDLKDPIRRMIQPKLGRLVLFPSFLWHGTVAFHASTPRTTVAFDVGPKAG